MLKKWDFHAYCSTNWRAKILKKLNVSKVHVYQAKISFVSFKTLFNLLKSWVQVNWHCYNHLMKSLIVFEFEENIRRKVIALWLTKKSIYSMKMSQLWQFQFTLFSISDHFSLLTQTELSPPVESHHHKASLVTLVTCCHHNPISNVFIVVWN